MARLVQKFGGTSVATLGRIKNVAEIVAESKTKHKDIIVVVSAMAGVTNKFVDCVNSLGADEGHPEYDTVLSSGELVTAGLTAIALEKVGIKSRSYASWQVPIFTNNNYGHAVIQNVDPSNINKDLEKIFASLKKAYDELTMIYDEETFTFTNSVENELFGINTYKAKVSSSLYEFYHTVTIKKVTEKVATPLALVVAV